MKIFTWNCSGAFRKKYRALDELDADVLIIQECENPAESTQLYRQRANNHLWTGENRNKGTSAFNDKKFSFAVALEIS